MPYLGLPVYVLVVDLFWCLVKDGDNVLLYLFPVARL